MGALLAACAPHEATLVDPTELRLEARRLAELGDDGAALEAYRDAEAAGDHGAPLEAGVVRAGGEPAWVDSLAPEARLHFRLQLDDIDDTASTARWSYTASVVALIVGGLLVGVGAISQGCYAGCWLEGDDSPRDALMGVGGGVALGGIALLAVGGGHDRASQRQRHEWREALRHARQVTRLELRFTHDGARLAGTF